MVAKICDPTADKNMAGVEKIHQTRQHIPDHLAAITDDIESSLIPFPAGCVDIFRSDDSASGLSDLTQGWAASVASGLHRLGSDRRSCCHGFQAASVSTGTQRSLFIYTNMPNIARRAIAAAMDFSIGNDPCSDTGSYFDKNEMIDSCTIPGSLFSQRHDIDIVINDYKGRLKSLLKKIPNEKIFPFGHQRRCYQNSSCKINRTRYAHTNSQNLGRTAALLLY